MEKIVESYLQLLLRAFQYDYQVFSENMWLYYWACIPALCYLVFFFIKWTALTAPVWVPFAMVVRGFKLLPTIQLTKR